MTEQVEETGLQRLNRLRAEAKELGITGQMSADDFEAAIKAKKEGSADPLATPMHEGLTAEEAKKIDARLKYEFEAQEKFGIERQRTTERATIVAEAESLKIKIDLPENPTELQLARARRDLGIDKVAVRPSPETVAIEASARGYYRFTNIEQDDAAHTTILGGKYFIHLIPGQVHVLSKFHVETWDRIAIVPKYERQDTGVVPSDATTGQMAQECVKVAGTKRFMFEFLGEAPQNAAFGMVTNMEVLKEFKQETEAKHGSLV